MSRSGRLRGTHISCHCLYKTASRCLLPEHKARAYEDIASWISIDAAAPPGHPNVLVGTVDEMEEQLRADGAEFGTSYVTVPQNALEAFTQEVGRQSGK